MAFNKKPIMLISCACASLLFTPLLWGTQAISTSCSVLRLQMHRTSGTKISGNKCTPHSELSLGAVIELQAGTRAWLEPIEKTTDNAGFQIVCLNKSSSVQKLTITSANFPWLAPLNSQGCSPWSVNRLACKRTDNQQDILLCAIAPKVSPTIKNVVQPKTSVPVRGFNKPIKLQAISGQDAIADSAAAGVNLCRQLLNTNQAVSLSWTISTTGAVTQASIIGSGSDKLFSACVLDALQQTKFPAVPHETQIKLAF